MDLWERYVGKSVYVILKSGRKYAGFIDSVQADSNGLIFISMTDSKDHMVTFTSGELELIQEEKK